MGKSNPILPIVLALLSKQLVGDYGLTRAQTAGSGSVGWQSAGMAVIAVISEQCPVITLPFTTRHVNISGGCDQKDI